MRSLFCRPRWGAVFVALAFAVPSAPARAQEAPASKVRPSVGDLSLSLGLPGGGSADLEGGAGVWWLLSDVINLGLVAGLRVEFDGNDAYVFSLAPTARFYLATQGRVSPFVHARVALRAFEGVTDDAEFGLGLEGGLGAELWLLPELSLSGHVGVGVEAATNDDGAFAIFTSGLAANFYFTL